MVEEVFANAFEVSSSVLDLIVLANNQASSPVLCSNPTLSLVQNIKSSTELPIAEPHMISSSIVAYCLVSVPSHLNIP